MSELSSETKAALKIGIPAGALLLVVLILTLTFSRMFFYAEPGYMYHITTMTGNESVESTPGYYWYGNGQVQEWKNSMTVQATDEDQIEGTTRGIAPLRVMFLDQVDAMAEATVRFAIPRDKETFLQMAHEYRTPENMMATALIPAFRETLQANASLMGAEEFYAGGRSQFNSEFEKQMTAGTYLVKRSEVEVKAKKTKKSANASVPDEGEDTAKTVFVVNKVLGENGLAIQKPQVFTKFQISVTSALITEVTPNKKFIDRMQLKQKASADRAIAREQRVQEEEQRLLAIAKGERQVAERQAKAKVEQIQKTTEAETSKQLAITHATKQKDQAQIEKETAAIHLETAKIKAKTKKTQADATAYQKREVLKADNALAQKLEAEIAIQKVWAEAFAKRKVPTTVMGDSASGGDGDAKAFMQLMTIDAAKRLNYDRQVAK